MTLLAVIGAAPSAIAADPAPTPAGASLRVESQSEENHFPSSVRFAIAVESDSPLAKATLYYRMADEALISYGPAQVTQGPPDRAEYVLDLRKDYSPPGVELQYRWRLEDQAGHKLTTDWRSFILDDPRYQWQVAQAENVELRWYRGGDSFGAALVEPTTRALAKLRGQAGIEMARVVKVFLYANSADFQSASPPGVHEWAGGRAFPRPGVILIAASPGELDFAQRSLPHELSHVAVYQATRNPYGGIPSWLDEGLAMLAEGDPQPDFDRALQSAVAEDRLISVWALSSNFPTDSGQAQLSYAESYSVVKFVVDRYGQASMSRLLGEFREGSTFDDALRGALGVNTYGLDDAWRASLGLGPALAASPAASAVPVRATATPGEPAPDATLPAALPVATAALVTTSLPTTPATAPPSGSGAGAGCTLPAALVVGVGGVLAAGGSLRRRRSGAGPDSRDRRTDRDAA